MKKRDKSKRYVMNLHLEIMPKRKQKFIRKATDKEIKKAIRDVFETNWTSTFRPLTPSESFRFDVINFSDPSYDEDERIDLYKLDKKVKEAGPKKKLKI